MIDPIRKQLENESTPKQLEEGIDYYLEGGLMVLTAKFLLNRGFCCDNGCRHCPYPKEKVNKD